MAERRRRDSCAGGGLQRVVATPTAYHPPPTSPASCPLHGRPYRVLERERTAIHAAKCTIWTTMLPPYTAPIRLDRPPRIAAGPWDDPFRVPCVREPTSYLLVTTAGGQRGECFLECRRDSYLILLLELPASGKQRFELCDETNDIYEGS